MSDGLDIVIECIRLKIETNAKIFRAKIGVPIGY